MAKDLGMKTKEVCSEAEAAGVAGKTTSASFEAEEFNMFFDDLLKRLIVICTGWLVLRLAKIRNVHLRQHDIFRLLVQIQLGDCLKC